MNGIAIYTDITRACTHCSPEVKRPDWLREAGLAAQPKRVPSSRLRACLYPRCARRWKRSAFLLHTQLGPEQLLFCIRDAKCQASIPGGGLASNCNFGQALVAMLTLKTSQKCAHRPQIVVEANGGQSPSQRLDGSHREMTSDGRSSSARKHVKPLNRLISVRNRTRSQVRHTYLP